MKDMYVVEYIDNEWNTKLFIVDKDSADEAVHAFEDSWIDCDEIYWVALYSWEVVESMVSEWVVALYDYTR